MPEVIYKVDLPAFTGRNVPIKEIAEHLNIATGTVKSRLNRGRQKLKELIQ